MMGAKAPGREKRGGRGVITPITQEQGEKRWMGVGGLTPQAPRKGKEAAQTSVMAGNGASG